MSWPRKRCWNNNNAIWKGCPFAKPLLASQRWRVSDWTMPTPRWTMNSTWLPFPATRSIANMAQLTPGARAQLDAFKAVTVRHAHLKEVDEQLSLWVEEHTDATHVLLCGPGGVGKSKALKVVAERFAREESDRFVVPILGLSRIPPDLGSYLRLDYYRQIINALKDHILVREILGKVAHLMAAPKATRGRAGATDWLDMREVAEQVLIRAHVKAVFVDEGHRLMQGDGSHSVDEQLEWLKSLTNRTKVLHVLAGPYALFGFRNTSGQLARRGRDIHFARYHVADKEERTAFVAALKYLLERVPLDVDLNANLARWRAMGSR